MSPPSVSGEGEEHLLHLLLGHRGVAVPGSEALAHAARHDLETGPVQRARHRGELGDHIGAVAPGLDHGDDPGQLALGAAEPVEHLALGVVVDLHRASILRSTCRIIPGGVCSFKRVHTRPGRLRVSVYPATSTTRTVNAALSLCGLARPARLPPASAPITAAAANVPISGQSRVRLPCPARAASAAALFTAITARDVPAAVGMSKPRTRTSAGTTTKPPPTPKNPVISPTPVAAAATRIVCRAPVLTTARLGWAWPRRRSSMTTATTSMSRPNPASSTLAGTAALASDPA